MSDRDAMLRAIAANPDDDTPRLIYADLLDELGGAVNAARARFIRLQIETQHGPGDTDRTLFERKLAEIDKLGVQYGNRWFAELPAGVSVVNHSPVTSHAFKRGFFDNIHLDCTRCAGDYEFLTLNPIKTLTVHTGNLDQLTALLACPNLARIQTLAFHSCNFRDQHLHEIARSSHLWDLQKLDVGNCLVSDRGLEALARAQVLSELRVLRMDCTGKGLTDSGIAALLTSPRLPKVREIDLCCYRRRQFWQSTNLQARFPHVRILY